MKSRRRKKRFESTNGTIQWTRDERAEENEPTNERERESK